MGRVRYLADHNLNEQIVDGVLRREPVIEFLRVRDVGPADRSDPDLLDWAAQNGCVIVSHDVNTMPAYAYERMAKGATMAGLLMVSQFEPIGGIIENLILIASASDAEEWSGVVAFLPL
jgi:hypothetical protein